LGSTSAFVNPPAVGELIERYPGWPQKQVGGGNSNWNVGEPTDETEMAMVILKSVSSNKGNFIPVDIIKGWTEWKRKPPKDIGNTVKGSLEYLENHPNAKFFEGGLQVYETRKNFAANGSLIRNGVIPVLFLNADQTSLIDITVNQGIITHAHPLSVLTCVVQSLIISRTLHAQKRGNLKPTALSDIKELITGPWSSWKKNTKNSDCKEWLQKIGDSNLSTAEKELIEGLQGFEQFDPWKHNYSDGASHCVLTLLIALWAVYWSFQPSHPKLPDWLPKWIFTKHKFETLMWVVSIGGNTDSYGATAGSLLAAFHPDIPASMLENLQVYNEVQSCVKQLCSQD